MRLQKYIAHAGVASRRKAEELIGLGKVKVNGEVIKDMGVLIDPTTDQVCVNNRLIKIEEKKVYIMLNKPEGYVTTLSDEFNRPTVLQLIEDINERTYPIGRLDYNTSGLLLMTNDGDLAFQLTHPKHMVWKTYIVKIKGIPKEIKIDQLRRGIDIGGYITAPAHVKMIKKNRDSSVLEVRIHEGKNRQVRKMFKKIDHPVLTLKRLAIGNLKVGDLLKGKWRYLTNEEVKYLKSL